MKIKQFLLNTLTIALLLFNLNNKIKCKGYYYGLTSFGFIIAFKFELTMKYCHEGKYVFLSKKLSVKNQLKFLSKSEADKKVAGYMNSKTKRCIQ